MAGEGGWEGRPVHVLSDVYSLPVSAKMPAGLGQTHLRERLTLSSPWNKTQQI